VEGSCERGNEPSGSIKRWEVLEWVHNRQLLKKGSAPCVVMSDANSIQSVLQNERLTAMSAPCNVLRNNEAVGMFTRLTEFNSTLVYIIG
jgi:hypothetical protein